MNYNRQAKVLLHLNNMRARLSLRGEGWGEKNENIEFTVPSYQINLLYSVVLLVMEKGMMFARFVPSLILALITPFLAWNKTGQDNALIKFRWEVREGEGEGEGEGVKCNALFFDANIYSNFAITQWSAGRFTTKKFSQN